RRAATSSRISRRRAAAGSSATSSGYHHPSSARPDRAMTQKTGREAPQEDVVLQDGVEYEEVTHDDRVIGKAVRVSLLVLGLILIGGGGAYWWSPREKELAPAQVLQTDAPKQIAHEVPPPAVRFTDITTSAGIDFVHQNGAEGEKLLPETMGGG